MYLHCPSTPPTCTAAGPLRLYRRLYDEHVSSSNYGATSVHISAPGQWIMSTTADGKYQYMHGTSQAAPQVAGAAALLLSVSPNPAAVTPAELKAVLMDSAAPKGWLAKKNASGGRLDAAAALAAWQARQSLTADAAAPSQTLLPKARFCRRAANLSRCAIKCNAAGVCRWVRKAGAAASPAVTGRR